VANVVVTALHVLSAAIVVKVLLLQANVVRQAAHHVARLTHNLSHLVLLGCR